jgi:hypothetical protein
MIILQIEHQVPDLEGWKKGFEADPIGREKSGVKEYRICRSAEDPNYIIIDLVFDTIESAQSTLQSLQALWSKVQDVVVVNPKYRVMEIIEIKKY